MVMGEERVEVRVRRVPGPHPLHEVVREPLMEIGVRDLRLPGQLVAVHARPLPRSTPTQHLGVVGIDERPIPRRVEV